MSDILFYYTGASSDGAPQSNPDLSLGNYRGDGEIPNDITENLFHNIINPGGGDFYKCICIKTLVNLINPKIWLTVVSTGAPYRNVPFAVEVPSGGDTNGNAQTIINEVTAPIVDAGNVSPWSLVASKITGVGVNQGAHDSNLDAGEIVFIWLRLNWVSLGPNVIGEFVTIRLEEAD